MHFENTEGGFKGNISGSGAFCTSNIALLWLWLWHSVWGGTWCRLWLLWRRVQVPMIPLFSMGLVSDQLTHLKMERNVLSSVKDKWSWLWCCRVLQGSTRLWTMLWDSPALLLQLHLNELWAIQVRRMFGKSEQLCERERLSAEMSHWRWERGFYQTMSAFFFPNMQLQI